MNFKHDLKRGMKVIGPSQREYGIVNRWDDAYIYTDDWRIPYSGLTSVQGNTVSLANDALDEASAGTARSTESAAREGETRVPIVDEQLTVEKRPVEMGTVSVRKHIETEQVNIPVDLRRERVDVQREEFDARRVASGDAATAFEDTTIRVPVRGEEAIAHKEAVVTGEVVVNREGTVERETVSDTLRRERVDIDKDFERARPDFQRHFTESRSSLGTAADTRPYEELEPGYRLGFQAGHDPCYANRQFEDAEPEVRRSWETGDGRGKSWEELHEAVREGWRRARR